MAVFLNIAVITSYLSHISYGSY